MDFDDIQRAQRNIRRKIARCKESRDRKRMPGLHDQLERIGQEIEAIRRNFESTAVFEPKIEYEQVKLTPPRLRRSYRYEAWCEELMTGRIWQCSLQNLFMI